MKNRKRVLAVILSSMIIMSSANVGIVAAANSTDPAETNISSESVQTEGLEYKDLGDGTVAVSKYSGTDTEVVVPAEYNGKTVVKINSYAFNSCKNVKKIVLPNTLVSIGTYAFIGCSGLEQIEIPDEVSEIGKYAFFQCSSLKSIVLPSSITAIAEQTFSRCTSLEDVTIKNSVKSVGNSAFYGCTSLQSVVLPNSVVTLYNNVFAECSMMKSLTIPSSVTGIGESLFGDTIPDELTIYGYKASAAQTFAEKNNIPFVLLSSSDYEYRTENENIILTKYLGEETSVTVPETIEGKTVIAIDNNAFKDCGDIESVVLPDTVASIGDSAFEGCAKLSKINIPSAVTSIGNSAFSDCSGLSSITLPANLTVLGSGAFKNCISLESITIPESISSLDNSIFSGCKSLKNVILPNTLTSIGASVCKNCTDLSAITLPDSLTSIGVSAFEGCTSLSSVVIPDSVDHIGYSAFSNCSGMTSITLPNTLTTLSNSVLSGCTALSSIEIPATVTAIGNMALMNCSGIETIRLPESVTKIGSSAFEGCTGLNSINIPIAVASIDEKAFAGCKALKNLTIPNNIETIKDGTFSGCTELEKLYVSASVTSIAAGNLDGCDSVTIYGYTGSEAENTANELNLPFVALDTLLNTSTTASQTITIGEDIEMLGSASGGTGDYTYSYYFKKSSAESWTAKVLNTKDSSVLLHPNAKVDYDIKIIAQDSFGNEAEKIIQVTVKDVPTPVNQSRLDVTTITLGESVTIYGAAEGGTGPYKFSYYFRQSGQTSWARKEVNTTNTSVTITPSKPVDYDIKVVVIDSNEKSSEKIFTVKVNDVQQLVNNSTLSQDTIKLGESVTVNAAAEGGSGTYTYSYYFKQTQQEQWAKKAVNTDETSVTIKPSKAVEYQIKVAVTDSNGKTAEKIMTVAVTDTAPPTNTSTVASESITLGESIVVNGSAQGGTGTYTYTYKFKKASQDNWTTKAADTEATSVTITPGVNADYDIMVIVKDSNKKTAEKTIRVKVNDYAKPTNLSTVSTEEIYLGDTVTLTGAASGGSGSYTYSYYFKQSGQTSWAKKEVNTTNTSVTIKPSKAVDYNFKVVVIDSNEKSSEKIFTVKVNDVQPPVNNSTLSKDTITLGESVTVNAAAEGGSGTYKYSYYFKQTQQEQWVKKAVDTTEESVTIKPSKAVEYQIKVIVSDSNGKTAEKIMTVAVTDTAPPTNTSTVASESITLGESIVVNGSAQGGTGTYTYTYKFKKASQDNWTTKAADTEATSVTITPGVNADYDIMVIVKDSNKKTAEKTIRVKVNDYAKPTNLSAVSTEEIYLGDTVTLTGAASGGSGSYTYSYYFKQSGQTSWAKKEVNTTNTSVTIKPSKAVDYNFKIVVIDSNEKSSEKIFTVKVNDVQPPVNHSTLSADTITLGESVTVNAAAEGGSGTYKYSYYFKQTQQEKWSNKALDTDETSVTIKPSKAVEYQIKVAVTDSNGKTAEKIMTVAVTDTAPPTNTSTVTSESITLGESIVVNGSAQGGTGTYTYTYKFKKASQDNWTTKAADTEATSVTITPGVNADYDIMVIVKDSNKKTAEKTIRVKVNDYAKPTNLSTVSTEEIYLGDTVTLTGAASGGSGSYTYSYYFKQSGQTSWAKKEVNTTNTSVTIKPSKAVDYNFKIVVIDSNEKSSEKIFTVKVNDVQPPVNNSTLSEDTITLGESVTVNAAAEGGSGTYNYSYYFKQTQQEQWAKKAVDTDETSVTIKPSKAVEYQIKVVVTDSNGKTAEKIMTVTVNDTAPLINASEIADDSITIGDSIIVMGAASGGSGQYTYSYYFKRSTQDAWSPKSVDTDDTLVIITPTQPAEYKVKAVVKDSNGKTAESEFTVMVNDLPTPVNNSTVASETIELGDSIVVMASAEGGSGSYTYSYYFKQSDQNSWAKKAENTDETLVLITPSKAVDYDVKVVVIDRNGKRAEKIITVSVK